MTSNCDETKPVGGRVHTERMPLKPAAEPRRFLQGAVRIGLAGTVVSVLMSPLSAGFLIAAHHFTGADFADQAARAALGALFFATGLFAAAWPVLLIGTVALLICYGVLARMTPPPPATDGPIAGVVSPRPRGLSS
jgi:hypothetical protein